MDIVWTLESEKSLPNCMKLERLFIPLCSLHLYYAGGHLNRTRWLGILNALIAEHVASVQNKAKMLVSFP